MSREFMLGESQLLLTSGLDDTTAPPTAAFNISPSCSIEDGGRGVGAAVATAELPATGLDLIVIFATASMIDIIKVICEIAHVVGEGLLVSITSLLRAPWPTCRIAL